MPRWTCDICCDEFRDYTSVYIDHCQVCVPCIRKMFRKALDFEHEYPPQWAREELHPSQFSHILQPDFVKEYEHREIEYKTPPTKRVYCQHMLMKQSAEGRPITEACGKFLGVRGRRVAPNQLLLARCENCENMTCMVCDGFTADAVGIFRHQCPGRSRVNEERARAFAGLKRGKDWQQCPNRTCGRRIELSEACNHMTCTCGTGFCFICGKEADGEDDHWVRSGGCPRYNQPGDRDVEYDDDGEYDEDEDEDDETDPLDDVHGLFEEAPTPQPTAEAHTVPAADTAADLPTQTNRRDARVFGENELVVLGGGDRDLVPGPTSIQPVQEDNMAPPLTRRARAPVNTIAQAVAETQTSPESAEVPAGPTSSSNFLHLDPESLPGMITAQSGDDMNFGGLDLTHDEHEDDMAMWEIFSALASDRPMRTAAIMRHRNA